MTTTTPDEQAYLRLLREIIEHGTFKPTDRTGVGTWSLFGRSLRFDLRNGRLPMLTTKKVYFKGVAKELLWFLKGDCTRTDALVQDNVHIWDLNSTREYLDSRGLTEYAEGELGPVYGYQWRHWGKPYPNREGFEKEAEKGIDQIQRIIDTIRTQPDDRRMVLSAWNVSDLDRMALPPCHMFAQFYVRTDKNNRKYLSCAMYQRSADMFLGVPFNITSYALLTHMIAHVTDCEPDELVMFFGDTHVYANHIEQVKTQLERSDQGYPFPTLRIVTETNKQDIDRIEYSDLVVEFYRCHETIPAPMAV
jgi:thymidylate synthase